MKVHETIYPYWRMDKDKPACGLTKPGKNSLRHNEGYTLGQTVPERDQRLVKGTSQHSQKHNLPCIAKTARKASQSTGGSKTSIRSTHTIATLKREKETKSKLVRKPLMGRTSALEES